jgi:hypothetical protein
MAPDPASKGIDFEPARLEASIKCTLPGLAGGQCGLSASPAGSRTAHFSFLSTIGNGCCASNRPASNCPPPHAVEVGRLSATFARRAVKALDGAD